MAFGHMIKDHSDSERGNPLPPHGLLFPINSKSFFYMHHPTNRIVHTTAFVTPVVIYAYVIRLLGLFFGKTLTNTNQNTMIVHN